MDELKSLVCQFVDQNQKELHDVSNYIWSNPELNLEEHLSHDKITTFLEKNGFVVERSTPLATSFIAHFGDAAGVKIGLLCEYDALPGIGHACGHNLIAEAGLGAALALKHVIAQNSDLKAQVVVFGTPAEEGGGGKILMLEKGCFDRADFCMMVHPFIADVTSPPILAIQVVTVDYFGKASHASCAPWDGINALDAAVQCYNNVSMMRQQIKPSDKIHGVITEGGAKPNIIPEHTQLEYYIRAPSRNELEVLKERFLGCVHAAAKGTGCQVKISWNDKPYYDLISNDILATFYRNNAESLGVKFPAGDMPSSMSGSTDMGNVSYVKPSIHPMYAIPTEGPNHTAAFATAAGADAAQGPTLIAAKSLAMTALDVVRTARTLHAMQEEFNTAKSILEKDNHTAL